MKKSVPSTLVRYLENPDQFVFPFVIKEKGKERRIITYNKAPDYGVPLRKTHETLLDEFQRNFKRRSPHSFAYHKGVCCRDALDDHLKSRFFIKLDIHHFFESITLEAFLTQYGYLFNDYWRNRLAACFYKGALSIGFVTSPELSDFYMRSFDDAVSAFILDRPELHYSRYSDDMLLSSEAEDDASLEELCAFIIEELSKLGLEINEKKTRRVHLDYASHNSISFLGLNLSKLDETQNKITISKRYILFLLFLIAKSKNYKDTFYPLENEIRSRVAYLAKNSPISFNRFQKKHTNIYGEPYRYSLPQEYQREAGTTSAEATPDYAEYAQDFEFDLHRRVVSSKTGLIIPDAIAIVRYIGSKSEVVIPDFVTAIADKAFQGKSSLKKVVFNNKLLIIGDYAFHGCVHLAEVSFGSSLRVIGEHAFERTGLQKADLPPNLTRISSNSFGQNPVLREVTMGDKVTSIETFAFDSCPRLECVRFSLALETIGASAFQNAYSLRNLVLPGSLTSIAASAFNNNKSLEELSLPDGLFTVGADAFHRCESLRHVHIGKSLIDISTAPFAYCPALQEIDVDPENGVYGVTAEGDLIVKNTKTLLVPLHDCIPSGIRHIGARAFAGKTIESIIIPEGVLSIGDSAFMNARFLKAVSVPSTLIRLGKETFSGCYSLEECALPDGVTTIPEGCFQGCSCLRYVGLGKELARIEKAAFARCVSLAVELPPHLGYIGHHAFEGCLSMASLHIPASTERIGKKAFYGLSRSLKTITVDPNNTVFYDGGANALIARKSGELFLGCASTNEIPNGVVAISSGAFASCQDLSSILLPPSVRFIRSNAFNGCTGLIKLDLSGVYRIEKRAFAHAHVLTEVRFGEGLVFIGEEAFFDTGIASLELPDSLSSVGSKAFGRCSALRTIVFPSGLSEWNGEVFHECHHIASIDVRPGNQRYGTLGTHALVKLPQRDETGRPMACARLVLGGSSADLSSGGFKLEANCFYGNEDLEELVLPADIDYIPVNAFARCSRLKRVVFPEDSVCTEIGKGAFRNCVSLEEVILPPKLLQIGGDAFKNTKALKTISLPESLKGIAGEAFEDSGLISIHIPDGVHLVGPAAFSGCTNLKHANIPSSCDAIAYSLFSQTALESIELGSLTRIPRAAFAGTNLTSITLPAQCVEISDCAFQGCKQLTEVRFNPTLETIGSSAFADCPALKDVAIPDSVISITNRAFANNPFIRKIHLSAQIGHISSLAFVGCDIESITVDPKNPYFSDYGSNVVVTKKDDNNPTPITLIMGCSASRIPEGVEIIASNAFGGKEMKNLSLPSSLISLETGSLPRGVDIIDGLPSGLERISGYAVEDVKNRELVFPSSLKLVENGAFLGCDGLETLRIEAGPLTWERPIAFNQKKSLRKISVDEKHPSLADIDGRVLTDKAKTEVLLGCVDGYIPDGVIVLADEAYTHVVADKVVVPDSVLSIGSSFLAESEVGELSLPASIQYISSSFAKRGHIGRIVIDPRNVFYKTNEDGTAIIRKSDSQLVYLSEAGTIPEGVVSAIPEAFLRSEKHPITRVDLPKSCLEFPVSPSLAKHVKNITVHQDNPKYRTDEGGRCLLSKDGRTLYLAPRGYGDIPEGVGRIHECAMCADEATTLSVPASVHFIHRNAFVGSSRFAHIRVANENTVFDDRGDALVITSAQLAILVSVNANLPSGVLFYGEDRPSLDVDVDFPF